MTSPKTVFVTGASGYIAKHIVLGLLQVGYDVTGSVRTATRAAQTRAAMQAHLPDEPNLDDRLTLVELDLASDAGWTDAMQGADMLLHTASPFPMVQPKNENDLIRPAVDGTLRALKSAQAAGINRVVMTSSSAAVFYSNPMPKFEVMTEDDWTDPTSPAATAYSRSKTLAERAAWEFAAKNPELLLTTINPVLVLGPALDAHFGTSLAIVQRLLRGKDPMVPRLMMDIVDVRDIAAMHIQALDLPQAIGERFIGSAGHLWFGEMARILKTACPDRPVPTRQAPDLLIRLLGLFDPAIRSITPTLGSEVTANSTKAHTVMGIDFIAPEKTLTDSALFLSDNDLIDRG